MNDLVALAVDRATELYGKQFRDGVFTAATFSKAITDLAGLNATIDGRLVRVILSGRPDVDCLGEGMYRRVRK
jgi:hypothetical protein